MVQGWAYNSGQEGIQEILLVEICITKSYIENKYGVSFKMKIELSYNLAITLVGICPPTK